MQQERLEQINKKKKNRATTGGSLKKKGSPKVSFAYFANNKTGPLKCLKFQ